MRKKIFASTVLLCVLTALAAFALALWTDYDGQRAFMQSETIRQAGNIKSACLASDDPEVALSALSDARLRITLIARDGTVLFDSTADEALMDNHQDRPEVEQAFASGTGSRTRLSDTLGEECFYYAQRLDDDTVLRVRLFQVRAIAGGDSYEEINYRDQSLSEPLPFIVKYPDEQS